MEDGCASKAYIDALLKAQTTLIEVILKVAIQTPTTIKFKKFPGLAIHKSYSKHVLIFLNNINTFNKMLAIREQDIHTN